MEGHQHQHGHATGAVEHVITWLGNFHPLIVHFPIALLISALLAEAMLWYGRWSIPPMVVRFLLVLGALGAVGGALLGWADWWHAKYSGDMAIYLDLHRWFGTATAGIAVLAAGADFWARNHDLPGRLRWSRALLILSALLVGVTGHFGGTLIYGPGFLNP
jgi:uncharacterized membrane protein